MEHLVITAKKKKQRNSSSAGTPQTVRMRLEEHPRYVQLRTLMMDALKPYPEARIAVARALEKVEES